MRWMDQSVVALQGTLDDADWHMFRCSYDDINVFTKAVVGFKKKNHQNVFQPEAVGSD